jgi:hypothetical protein
MKAIFVTTYPPTGRPRVHSFATAAQVKAFLSPRHVEAAVRDASGRLRMYWTEFAPTPLFTGRARHFDFVHPSLLETPSTPLQTGVE